MALSTLVRGRLSAYRHCSSSFFPSSLGVQRRFYSDRPWNTVMVFVPQQEAWIIERFGRFTRILNPGLNFLWPVVERINYVQSLKEIAIEIPEQSAITSDNVPLNIDGVLYVRVVDPYKASYGVEDAQFAISQIAQTTMRSEIGKIALDNVFKDRELLNTAIVAAINKASDAWGLNCLRYEIKNITVPEKVVHAMQMQVEAERKKRAQILESEGHKTAEINVAEGKKQSAILASEAEKAKQINIATGEAEAIIARAKARAESVVRIAESMAKPMGENAVSWNVAEQYVAAFEKLAKETNTVLLPAQANDVNSMVAQALTIYQSLDKKQGSSKQTS